MPRAAVVIALGLATALAGERPARAQEPPDAAELAQRLGRSHDRLPDDSLSSNPGETLLLRFLKAQEVGLLWDQYQEIRKDPQRYLTELRGGQSEALEKLATGIRRGELRLDKEDPLIRDLVRQFSQPGDGQALLNKLPQELRQPVEELLRRAGKSGPGGAGMAEEEGTAGGRRARGPSASAAFDGGIGGLAGAGGGATAPVDGESRFGIWLRRQVQALALNEGVLRNSEGLRQALDEVLRARLTRPGEGLDARQSLAAEFSRWAGRAVPREFLGQLGGLGLEKISWPSLGDLKLPELRAGPPSAWPSVPGGEVRAPSAQGVGVFAAAAAVALGLAWLLGRRGRGRAKGVRRRRGRPFQLGAWPVRPTAVATTDDVIKAFEYVSVLRLGPAVRTWNHRAIAGRLGADRPEAGRAAHQLADRYEDARYAPEPAPLSPESVAALRRDLVVVAGGTPA